MATLYGLLDGAARNWWYHAELRRNGKADEARKLERKSIRDHARMWREARDNGGFLHLGRGGFTLHYSENARLQGYDCDHEKACAVIVGVTVIDTRAMPLNAAARTLRFPMATMGKPDPEPWHSMSYAPVAAVAAMYQAAGAAVLLPK